MNGKIKTKTETMGTLFNASITIHPTVIGKVNGVKVRIMLDRGGGGLEVLIYVQTC